MEPVTSIALQQFLQRLGEQIPAKSAGQADHPAKFYLLGGSALSLLGSPRETLAEAPLDLLETHTLPLIDTELENLP